MSKLFDIESSPQYKLKCSANYTIQGSSKAGFQTGFRVKELNVLLDCGVFTSKLPKAVFITHSHNDHSWLLPYIVKGRNSAVPIYFPEEAYEPIMEYQQSIKNLGRGLVQKDGDVIWKIQSCIPHKLRVNDIISVENLNNVQIEVLKCYHSCSCIGYGFNTISSKLKKEYIGKGKNVIINAKNQGINITEKITVPQFIFFGDTDIRALTEHEEWKKYPSIIIECTGYNIKIENDKYTEIANMEYKSGHICISDIIPILKLNPCKQFILSHSSCNIDKEELEKIEKYLQMYINPNTIIIKN